MSSHRSAAAEAESHTIRFPGQYYDEETDLHYNRFRYYDPELGRYVSADPIGQAGGINVYNYALNNPVNLTDPTGELAALLAVPLAGAAIGGAFGFAGQVASNAAAGCDLLDGAFAAGAAGAGAGALAAGAGFIAGSLLGSGAATAYAAGTSGIAGYAAATATGSSNRTGAVGTAVGAAVGSAIAPGPGTVIGATAGATMGSTLGFVGSLAGIAAGSATEAECGCPR